MKFWQVLSAFRKEPGILQEVLSHDKWEKYFQHYNRIDEIISGQERDILDEELPFELCYEVAEKSIQEYWLSFDTYPNVLYSYRPGIKNVERVFPAEILSRFGGDKIEEAHESSETDVIPRKLNGNVEVINSYNLSSIGMVLILRSTGDGIIENNILSNIDESKRWLLVNEFRILTVNPVAGYEKLEAQRKQDIKHYTVKCIEHNDKPKPGELLTLARNSQ